MSGLKKIFAFTVFLFPELVYAQEGFSKEAAPLYGAIGMVVILFLLLIVYVGDVWEKDEISGMSMRPFHGLMNCHFPDMNT